MSCPHPSWAIAGYIATAGQSTVTTQISERSTITVTQAGLFQVKQWTQQHQSEFVMKYDSGVQSMESMRLRCHHCGELDSIPTRLAAALLGPNAEALLRDAGCDGIKSIQAELGATTKKALIAMQSGTCPPHAFVEEKGSSVMFGARVRDGKTLMIEVNSARSTQSSSSQHTVMLKAPVQRCNKCGCYTTGAVQALEVMATKLPQFAATCQVIAKQLGDHGLQRLLEQATTIAIEQ